MILHIILSSGKEVKIGTLIPVSKALVKLYVKKYDRVWLEL